MKLLPLLMICFTSIFLPAQSIATLESLDEKIDSLLQKGGIPGAQLAIVHRDSVVHIANFGYADLENQLPVTDNTMFRIGSVTKSFIALSAMMLVEEGKLKLKDELKSHTSEIPYYNKWSETHPILIENLMEHTTGFDDLHLVEYATSGEGWSTLQGIQFHPDSKQSRWRPGTHTSYCNAGPPIVAHVIENISGKTIEAFVQNQIFDPLGMTHSCFLLTDHVKKHLSKGYFDDDDKEAPYWHIIDRAAGSINSSASEMARYVQLYLNRGRWDSLRLVTASSIFRMERPETTLAAKAGITEGYGLHIVQGIRKGYKVYGHSGGMNGYLAMLNYVPEKDVGYIFMINKAGGNFNKLNETILEYMLGEPKTLVPSNFTGTYDPQFLGWFKTATTRNQFMRFADWLGNVVHISEEKGQLYVQQLFGEKQPLSVEGTKVLRRTRDNGSSFPLVLLKDNNGHTILQAPGMGNYYKTSAGVVWASIGIGALSVLLILSTLLVGIIWGAMWLLGKHKIRFKRARIWPTLAALSLVGMALSLSTATGGDGIEKLGMPSPTSYAFFVSSILFGLFSFTALITALLSFGRSMHKVARIYFFFASLASTITAGYLLYWGVIGMRTWVY